MNYYGAQSFFLLFLVKRLPTAMQSEQRTLIPVVSDGCFVSHWVIGTQANKQKMYNCLIMRSPDHEITHSFNLENHESIRSCRPYNLCYSYCHQFRFVSCMLSSKGSHISSELERSFHCHACSALPGAGINHSYEKNT